MIRAGRPAGGDGLNLLLLSFRLASELHPNIEGSTGRSKRSLSLAAQMPSMHLRLCPPSASLTAQRQRTQTLTNSGPLVAPASRPEQQQQQPAGIFVHSLIVRHTSHIVRSILVCQNGICRPACRRGVAKLETECPDGSGLRLTQTQTL